MGVRSSMSAVRILAKLKRLLFLRQLLNEMFIVNRRIRSSVACYSYGLNGLRVSFPVRQMLRLMSALISRNIERLSYAQRLLTASWSVTLPAFARSHSCRSPSIAVQNYHE